MAKVDTIALSDTYIFVFGVQGVPHRGDDLRHLAETRVWVLSLDSRLGVAEEERVRRHRPETNEITPFTPPENANLQLPLLALLKIDPPPNQLSATNANGKTYFSGSWLLILEH